MARRIVLLRLDGVAEISVVHEDYATARSFRRLISPPFAAVADEGQIWAGDHFPAASTFVRITAIEARVPKFKEVG